MRPVTGLPDGLEPIETASRDELADLQLRRLRETLHHAYANVPFYRTSFDARGLHPNDCKSLQDLVLFPFTTKHDLRDNYPFGMFAVPRERVSRIHASSGTTGRPTVVGYTRGDLDMWAHVVARSLRAAGCTRATWCTWRTATGCSPAGWARTTVRNGSVAPSFPCPAA